MIEKNSYASILDQYFQSDIMSIHIKAGTQLSLKQGGPGAREMKLVGNIMTQQEVKTIIATLHKEVECRDDATIEIERNLSTVIQMGNYRIVIVYPPLSDDYEITVVRPVKRLTFDDYHIDNTLVELLKNKAQGILVAGSPGSGKTTFAQALIDMYVDQKKIVKTIEAPRDLQVSDDVVQYSFSHGTHDEVRDILLLSRPDFTVYDEVRNQADFVLYKDLRLTGIGLIGVIHATKAIDSIQRFIGVVSLGMIPQVIDTIIFIQEGAIHTVYTLSFTVKTPSGMMSEDLARPVVEVKNFFSGQLVYELYSFGEQVVVMPLDDLNPEKLQSGSLKLASLYIEEYLSQRVQYEYGIDIKDNTLDIYVPYEEKGSLIGKGGDTVRELEKELGMHVSIKTFEYDILGQTVRIIKPHNMLWKKKKRFRYK
ncbi:Type II/IV secretion system protein [candidate division SR1 bacterium Aalborg_AAW-1]|nr:Type II/IV secretion system protein [candidate division SR1 bacterium Aalborg_AAW-1]